MADSAHQTMVPFQNFATADGWLVVACPKQALWERLCDALGRPELRSRRALRRLRRPRPQPRRARSRSSERASRARPTAEWLELLERARRPVRAGQRRRGRARRPAGGRARRRGRVRASGARRGARRRRARSARRVEPPTRARAACSASTPAEVLRELCGYDERADRRARGGGRLRRRTIEVGEHERASGAAGSSRTSRSGDVYRSRLGRTVTEADNIWFTCLTMNTNQMHFNREYAERTEFGAAARRLDAHARARARALGRGHIARTRSANLGWGDIKLPKPVFAGDTLWAESEVLEAARVEESRPRAASSRSGRAGLNQRARGRDRVHAQLHGVSSRDAPEVADAFPATDEAWTVGEKD